MHLQKQWAFPLLLNGALTPLAILYYCCKLESFLVTVLKLNRGNHNWPITIEAQENVCKQRYGNLKFARDWLKTLHVCSDWLECVSWVSLKCITEFVAKAKSKQAQLPIRNLWQIGELKTNTFNRFALGLDLIWPRNNVKRGIHLFLFYEGHPNQLSASFFWCYPL